MAHDRSRPQHVGRQGARSVLEQRPHVGNAVSATLEEYRHATRDPDVYPCAKMAVVRAFKQGPKNGVSPGLEANTEVQRDVPVFPQVLPLPRNVGWNSTHIDGNGSAIPS